MALSLSLIISPLCTFCYNLSIAEEHNGVLIPIMTQPVGGFIAISQHQPITDQVCVYTHVDCIIASGLCVNYCMWRVGRGGVCNGVCHSFVALVVSFTGFGLALSSVCVTILDILCMHLNASCVSSLTSCVLCHV